MIEEGLKDFYSKEFYIAPLNIFLLNLKLHFYEDSRDTRTSHKLRLIFQQIRL